jgi:hypothetical protein
MWRNRISMALWQVAERLRPVNGVGVEALRAEGCIRGVDGGA